LLLTTLGLSIAMSVQNISLNAQGTQSHISSSIVTECYFFIYNFIHHYW